MECGWQRLAVRSQWRKGTRQHWIRPISLCKNLEFGARGAQRIQSNFSGGMSWLDIYRFGRLRTFYNGQQFGLIEKRCSHPG